MNTLAYLLTLQCYM